MVMKPPILKALLPILLMVMVQSARSEEELLTAAGISGTVVDAHSKKPIPYAVVSVAWALQARKDVPPTGQRTRLGVLQRYADKDGKFVFEGWKMMRAEAVRGGEIIPGRDPMVRIYAKGYQRLDIANLKGGKSKRPFNSADAKILQWVGQGKTQTMKPLVAGDKVLASELRGWRKDLDEEIQAVSLGRDKTRAMNSQQKLLTLFNDQCKTLSDDVRQQICYAPDSDVAQHINEDAEVRAKNLVYDRPDGERQVIPVQMVPPPPGFDMQSSLQGGVPAQPPSKAQPNK